MLLKTELSTTFEDAQSPAFLKVLTDLKLVPRVPVLVSPGGICTSGLHSILMALAHQFDLLGPPESRELVMSAVGLALNSMHTLCVGENIGDRLHKKSKVEVKGMLKSEALAYFEVVERMLQVTPEPFVLSHFTVADLALVFGAEWVADSTDTATSALRCLRSCWKSSTR
ncbi:MAG: uncharacterized protein KVP18_004815 [Porospora cf. gigantea A]|uniref:uncharacterized protein n=1 Tax=Porospora cf. gigantea A TaxID=2853593 RepID=UPI00355A30C5|nr:MAG: hypothetical protein KVP18_004815 [Porospora cf. gigantea A]